MSQSQFYDRREPVLVQHASAEEYAAFVQAFTDQRPYGDPTRMRAWLLRCRTKFVSAYPDLHEWLGAPLTERVGRLYQEDYNHPCCPISYRARHYLTYLALRGYVTFDWEWLIATHHLVLEPFLPVLGYPTTLSSLVETAVNLGYEWKDSRMTLQWAVSRVLLHLGSPHLCDIRAIHLAEFEQAIARFGDRADVTCFFGSRERYQQGIREEYLTDLHLLQTVLYHQGQIQTELYRVTHLVASRPPLKPQMEAVVTRYLSMRCLTDQSVTVEKTKNGLYKFIDWLAQAHPLVESWRDVTRDQVMEYANALHTMINKRGKLYAAQSKYKLLSNLAVFFQDTISWEWEDVPLRPPLQHGDLPKLPKGIPRYIPEAELDQLMPAIRALDCPYQRAALLIARWSGARREEIGRLSVDCLDSYPNGTPRLRLPAGKTKRERIVPLNEEAASAIRLLQAKRRAQRGLRDRLTGRETNYLFMHHGRLISTKYLFEDALTRVCQASGLTTVDNKRRVTAHRFRHTVGAALARKGARLRTIQKILGHESVEMALVYIGLTDEDVRQDYQNVLGPDALIAGPGATMVQSGELAESGKSSDEKQRERAGLDMRGADLREVDLSSLPLARLLGGEILSQAWLPAEHAQRYPASIHLEEANLHDVHLEGANLTYAHLEGANLYRAHLEEADLHYARLEGARLIEAHLEKVQFYRAHLEDADLLEAHLDGADLTRAFLNGATRLRKVTLGNKQQGVVSVAGVHWNDADLSVVDWTQVRVLGDETEAHQPTTGQGKKKTGGQRLEEYQITVQAYRRLALALQAQGLTEQGTRFAYRAQKLERVVFRRQGRVFSYLFSWFLYLLAGYGYKPARSFLAYLLIIGTFTIIYSALGPHLSWNEALVISMTAFHGRGFFPGTFSPGDPLALASAMEAFVGLIIEVTLIATLTQRFFGK